MSALPFMDVTLDDGVVELPELKLRELVFVGALRRAADGTLERDATRPVPPFRLSGLFPDGSRFRTEPARAGRVRLRRLDGSPAAPQHPLESALAALRGPDGARTSLDGGAEHVLTRRPPFASTTLPVHGLTAQGTITAPDAADCTLVFAAVPAGGAAEAGLRAHGFALAHARWLRPAAERAGEPASPATS